MVVRVEQPKVRRDVADAEGSGGCTEEQEGRDEEEAFHGREYAAGVHLECDLRIYFRRESVW
jgi:hypothetical protein